MVAARCKWSFVVALCVVAPSFIASPCTAQVTLDGTLGRSGSLSGPAYSITPDLGKQVGGNLFHSFSRFDIRTGESATFSGPNSVANIISRVTGAAASSIDGLLRSTIPNANFYLINPKGVAFGPNASLDIGGSFYASSADQLRLADGGRLDAINPAASTLTSAPPAAFGFLSSSPAAITASGATLGVQSGKALTLVGGDLQLANAALLAPGGQVKLASMASAGDTNLGPATIETGAAPLGAISLANSQLDVSGAPGLPAGSIYIRGGKLATTDSGLSAVNLDSNPGGAIALDLSGELSMRGGGFSSVAMVSGAGNRISIAAGAVSMDNEAAISTVSLGSGKGGKVSVAAGTVSLAGGAQIASDAWAGGPGGELSVTAGTRLDITGISPAGLRSGLFSTTRGSQPAGAISVTTPVLAVNDGGVIAAATVGAGQGAEVRINAGVIDMDYGTLSTDAGGSGSAGKLIITAKDLRLSRDSAITTITQGPGAGGDIELNAETVEIAGGRAFPGGFPDPATGLTYYGFYSGIYTTSQGANSGSGGTLRLRTRNLRVADGGTLSGITLGRGDAGSFYIETDTVSLESGGLIHTSTSGSGAAGSIAVDAERSISISGALDANKYSGFAPRGSSVSGVVSKATLDLNPSSPSLGNGGAISVSAPLLTLSGGAEISTSAEKNAAGGIIAINAARVELSNGSSISAESSGTGNAGKIALTMADTLRLSNGASITTQATSADGGDIEIKAGSLVHLSSSRITTSVGTGFGNGGNIRIDPEFVVLDASRIIANAYGGNGGNIRIVAQNFVSSPNSVVDASSQLGIDGNVEISSPQVDVGAGLGVLPAAFFDASSLLRESCAARAGRAANSFVGIGRGGLPAGPEGSVFSAYAALYRNPDDFKTSADDVAKQTRKALMRLAAGGCGLTTLREGEKRIAVR